MKKIIPAIFFLLFSAILIFSWFRYGYIYGGGDVGLQTYNPTRFLDNARFIWWETVAPGVPIPLGLTSVPLQFFLSLLQSLGFTPLMMQASLFFLFLFMMGYGMFLFTKSILGPDKNNYAILAGFFYMFNPYMMIQVWHRFIHNSMVLAAVLPFLAIFWISWIKKGSYKSLLFFLMINTLAVYLYGTMAFIVTCWLFFFSISLLEGILPWRSFRNLVKIGVFFLIGLILWLLTNSWWLIPVYKISPVALAEQHKTEESLYTLINISAQAVLPHSLRLINPFYLYYQAEFGNMYQNFIFQLIPWVFTAIILGGFMYSFRYKNFSSYGILFLISLFLAKGAAPPFGNLYIQAFTYFFPLGVLRNPFEKTGLILVFFATILFVLGINFIILFAKKINIQFSRIIIISTFFLILIFAYPMFTGKVFGRPDKGSFVEVPQSYKQADQYLSEQKLSGISNGRLLHLPLPRGESVTYKWNFGYNGLEPSDTFFTAYPSISRGFNIKRLDDALTSLSLIFDKTYFDKELALKYLQDFDVRFIVLHKDTDWAILNLYDPLETEKLLDSLEFLEREKEFGDLVIYKLVGKYYQGKVSLISDFSLIYPGDETLKKPIFLREDLMVTPVKKIDKSLAQESSRILIFPKNSFKYGFSSASANISEPLLLSNLEEYKVSLGKMGFYLSEKLTEKVINASKLLSEALNFKNLNQRKELENNINEYQIVSRQIFQSNIDLSKFAITQKESALSTLFRFHLLALKELESSHLKSQIIEIEKKLSEDLISNYLLPKNSPGDSLQRQFLFFDIPYEGKYKLTNPEKEKLGISEFMLDGKKVFSKEEQLDLDEGGLEISYPAEDLVNDDRLILTSVKQEGVFSRENSIASLIKDSPIQYRGNIKLDKPAFLFFKETFHTGWKLLLNKDGQIFIPKEHHLANLYGNAWYIDKAGDYSFKIEFEPQKYFNTGIILSILGGLFILAAAIIKRKIKI